MGTGIAIKADLVSGTLSMGDYDENFTVEPDFTYLCQHKAVMDKNYNDVASLEDGIEVLKLIEAIEEASERKVWIKK